MKRITDIRPIEIENTKVPYLGDIIESNLSHWIGNFNGVYGHDLMEKVLSLLMKYRFDNSYLNIIDETTFELLTESNKKITITYYNGDFDRCGGILITEDNIQKQYELINSDSKELSIELISVTELSTGFEESYSYYGNPIISFEKVNNNSRLYFSSKELYNISEREYDLFKSQFKKTEFKDIIDLYYFIVDKWPTLSKNFRIEEYGPKERYYSELLQRIEVSNNRIKDIELIKEVNGNKFKISGTLENELDNNTLSELVDQIADLNNNQIQMRLKKDIS